MPIYIRNQAGSVQVSPGGFAIEKELEDLLADSPNLLCEDGSPGIALVDRQVNLPGTGILDLLFVTSEGLPIAVEVKLACNIESRREVVAQAVDYLSTLTAFTVDELDDRVHGKLGEALIRLADENDSDFESLWKATGANLRAGKARLTVVLDRVPADLERIFRFLARYSKLDAQLFAVQRYRSGDGHDVFVSRSVVNRASEEQPGVHPSLPPKSLEELLEACLNPAEVEFFKEQMEQNQRTNSHGNAFAYPPSGSIRWYAKVGKNRSRVSQIGRFQNDEEFWRQTVSTPDFKYAKGKKILRFYLSTSADFASFQKNMEHLAPNFSGSKASS